MRPLTWQDQFTRPRHISRLLWLAGLVSLVLCVGCAKKRTNQDYTPSEQVARDALRRGLDAWKAGDPAGEVRGTTSPVVHIVDGGRKPGQALEAFEILGETRGPAGRAFVVMLHLTSPTEEIKTRYIVVGIDPLWIFREEDFDLLMHWDHRMPSAPPDEKSGDKPATPENSIERTDSIERSE